MKHKLLILSTIVISTNLYAASFIGTYDCHGQDPYLNREYKGTVKIVQQDTVYNITMQYDTGEVYKATGGQYNEELLSVVFQDAKDLHKVGLEQYRLSADKKQMGGFWVYLGKDKLGKEVCIKQA